MKVWFDTEFIENGKTIQLISIGLVTPLETLYLESKDYNPDDANDWVKKNVIPHLNNKEKYSNKDIAEQIRLFVGKKPDFWGYFSCYDWVLLCQLYGSMMNLPATWPMYCNDIQQLRAQLGFPTLPRQSTTVHNALNDAMWTKESYDFLIKIKQNRLYTALSDSAAQVDKAAPYPLQVDWFGPGEKWWDSFEETIIQQLGDDDV